MEIEKNPAFVGKLAKVHFILLIEEIWILDDSFVSFSERKLYFSHILEFNSIQDENKNQSRKVCWVV